MATEIKVPVLPESVSDATIATWHKKAGDSVKRDENIVDLETDKVVLEVPSTVDGVLKEIKFEEGATVNSQQVIAVIEEGATGDGGKDSGDDEVRRSPDHSLFSASELFVCYLLLCSRGIRVPPAHLLSGGRRAHPTHE